MKRHTTAVLLSAGMGKRMGDLTRDRTKSLIEINNKPLISYMLDFVKHVGVDDTVVVGGYHFDKLKKVVKELDQDVLIVENQNYEDQNLLSLDVALANITKGGVLVCNTDYIFSDTTADSISKNMDGVSTYCSFDLSGDDDDVMRVEASKKNELLHMSKELDVFNAIYTGISFFDEASLPLVRDTIVDVLKEFGKKDATVEYVLRELVDKGHLVKVADVGKADWFEFDTPEDLEKAERVFKQ